MTPAQPRRYTLQQIKADVCAMDEEEYYLASDIDPLLQELSRLKPQLADLIRANAELATTTTDALVEVARLRERVAGMEKDAKRYGVLRDLCCYPYANVAGTVFGSREQCDAHCDSATGGG